jgi:hypothetical protein
MAIHGGVKEADLLWSANTAPPEIVFAKPQLCHHQIFIMVFL